MNSDRRQVLMPNHYLPNRKNIAAAQNRAALEEPVAVA